MLQELLPLLPKEVETLALVLTMIGTLMGAGLWLIGSRYSRSLITLLLVSAGGWIGLFLPKWFGWRIEGWASAIAFALVLGASGFIFHRFWVGIGLGLVMAGWATAAVWTLCKGVGVWKLPKFETGTAAWAYAKDFWLSLPVDVQKFLPFAAGTALLSGLATAMLWPRIGAAFLYSIAGVSMVVGLGLCAMNMARPEWIVALPAKVSSQVLAVAGMVAFGVLLQWQLGPQKAVQSAKQRMPLIVHE